MSKRNIPAALVAVGIGASIIYALQNPQILQRQGSTDTLTYYVIEKIRQEKIEQRKQQWIEYCEQNPDDCPEPSKPSVPTAEKVEADNLSAALDELRQDNKIKSVAADKFAVYVGVLDNGTARTGYAMYVCEVLREHNAEGRMVNVLDVVQASTHNKTVVLGKFKCN